MATTNSVASEISFSEKLARKNFDARTATLKAQAQRPLDEAAAGAAAARARQNGQPVEITVNGVRWG